MASIKQLISLCTGKILISQKMISIIVLLPTTYYVMLVVESDWSTEIDSMVTFLPFCISAKRKVWLDRLVLSIIAKLFYPDIEGLLHAK